MTDPCRDVEYALWVCPLCGLSGWAVPGDEDIAELVHRVLVHPDRGDDLIL